MASRTARSSCGSTASSAGAGGGFVPEESVQEGKEEFSEVEDGGLVGEDEDEGEDDEDDLVGTKAKQADAEADEEEAGGGVVPPEQRPRSRRRGPLVSVQVMDLDGFPTLGAFLKSGRKLTKSRVVASSGRYRRVEFLSLEARGLRLRQGKPYVVVVSAHPPEATGEFVLSLCARGVEFDLS